MTLLAALWTSLFLLSYAQNAATGSIEGAIWIPAGAPAAGVRVSAMAVPGVSLPLTEASVSLILTLTDESGRYRLAGIPPGRNYITAGAVANPTYHPGTTKLDGARHALESALFGAGYRTAAAGLVLNKTRSEL